MPTQKKEVKLLSNKKSIHKMYIKIAIYTIFIICLIYGASFWTSFDKFIIKEIKIEGNNFIKKEQIEEIVKKEMEGEYFNLFSKKSFLFLQEKKIKNNILKLIPVEDAKIFADNINSVSVIIKEYEAKAYWCSDAKGKDCYFLNKNGTLFAKVENGILSELVKMEGKLESKNENDFLGQNFSTADNFFNLLNFVSLLKNEGVFVNQIKTEDFESFNLKTTIGPVIIVKKDSNSEKMILNFKSTIAQESIHDKQFSNLDYVDLRFDDRVYYKIK